jgi:hypothetical protein
MSKHDRGLGPGPHYSVFRIRHAPARFRGCRTCSGFQSRPPGARFQFRRGGRCSRRGSGTSIRLSATDLRFAGTAAADITYAINFCLKFRFVRCDRGRIGDIIDCYCSRLFFLHLGICTFLSLLAPLLSSHTSLGTQPTLIPTPFLIPSPSPSSFAGSPWEGSRHPICSHDVDVSSRILHSNFKSIVRSKQKEKEAQKSEE